MEVECLNDGMSRTIKKPRAALGMSVRGGASLDALRRILAQLDSVSNAV